LPGLIVLFCQISSLDLESVNVKFYFTSSIYLGFYFVLFVSVMVGVAFLTLLEWRFLGYIQIYKGPNKMGFKILQPCRYAIELFSREHDFHLVSNYLLLFSNFCFISFLVWFLSHYLTGFVSFELDFFFFLGGGACNRLGVYAVMMAGWSSNSAYSLMGGFVCFG